MITLKRLNRKMLDILSLCDNREDKIKETTALASTTLDAEVYLIDAEFNILSKTSDQFDSEFFERFCDSDLQRENIDLNGSKFIISPLVSSRKFLGFLAVAKNEEFTENEIIIFEIFRNFSIITLENIDRDKNFKKQRQINIVKNSIEAMNGVGNITVNIIDREGIAEIEVIDDGIGITESVIKRLQKGHFTTKPNGSGVGTVIINNILKIYNGEFNLLPQAIGTKALIKIPHN